MAWCFFCNRDHPINTAECTNPNRYAVTTGYLYTEAEVRKREKAAWMECATFLRYWWGGSAGERTFKVTADEAARRYGKEEKA